MNTGPGELRSSSNVDCRLIDLVSIENDVKIKVENIP